jgi:negative regulator of genetic competence, sporulation and motility
LQAWIREEEEEACNVIKTAIYSKHGWGEQKDEASNKNENNINYKNQETPYIKFIAKFGPAMTGVSFWNNNKTNTVLSELITVTDEAFIHLCMANYA